MCTPFGLRSGGCRDHKTVYADQPTKFQNFQCLIANISCRLCVLRIEMLLAFSARKVFRSFINVARALGDIEINSIEQFRPYRTQVELNENIEIMF